MFDCMQVSIPHVSRACRSQKRCQIDSLGLELQMLVCYHGGLKTKHGSSGRTESALNLWVVSKKPPFPFGDRI